MKRLSANKKIPKSRFLDLL